MYRNIGNLGCFILILVFILLISMFSLAFNIIFKTPVGLILLGYVIYRLYFRKKPEPVEETFEVHDEPEEVIDVDYEEYD